MKRVSTFVAGLDEILEGGVPDGSFVLIMGSPGTMKTSLAYSILHHNAIQGERGLYVSLEQSRDSLLAHTSSLGLPLEDATDNLSILDIAGLRRKFAEYKDQSWPWVDLLKLYTKGLKASFNYRILALDSLDALELVADFQNVRREVFDLIQWFRGLGCTTFVIGEAPSERGLRGTGEPLASTRHEEEYLADGIFRIRKAKQGEFGVQRQLRVVKMRGTRHETSYHVLLFENGFRISPILT